MAVFFFMMLFTLGVGSAVGLLSNLTTNLKDYFPKLKYWQLALIGAVCGFSFGLIYVTHGGIHMIDLVDHFGGQFLVFALATLELVGVVWIYGLENLCWDVEFMLKRKVTPFWRISWFIVMPLFLIMMSVVFIYKMAIKEHTFPAWALTLGWTLFAIGLGQVVFSIAYIVHKKRFDDDSTLKFLLSPNPEWAPKSNSVKAEWITFKANKLRERKLITQTREHSWLHQKYWLLMGKYP